MIRVAACRKMGVAHCRYAEHVRIMFFFDTIHEPVQEGDALPGET